MNLENVSNVEAKIIVNLPGLSFEKPNGDPFYETEKRNIVSFSPAY